MVDKHKEFTGENYQLFDSYHVSLSACIPTGWTDKLDSKHPWQWQVWTMRSQNAFVTCLLFDLPIRFSFQGVVTKGRGEEKEEECFCVSHPKFSPKSETKSVNVQEKRSIWINKCTVRHHHRQFNQIYLFRLCGII